MAATNDPTRKRVLHILKTRGPKTVAELAQRLDLTAMGVRGHLAKLRDEGLVEFETESGEVGRPAQIWRLTPQALGSFPEGYSDLAVELIGDLGRTFGGDGLQRLIGVRTKRQIAAYRDALPGVHEPLPRRVQALARIRTGEGYMAETRRERDGSVLLIENHCPICAAAEACTLLCSAELELFQKALGSNVSVERSEHLLEGARRCVYRVTERRKSAK